MVIRRFLTRYLEVHCIRYELRLSFRIYLALEVEVSFIKPLVSHEIEQEIKFSKLPLGAVSKTRGADSKRDKYTNETLQFYHAY